jgi:hypothetical protein
MTLEPDELEDRVRQIAVDANWDHAELIRSMMHLIVAWGSDDMGDHSEALIEGLSVMAEIERQKPN